MFHLKCVNKQSVCEDDESFMKCSSVVPGTILLSALSPYKRVDIGPCCKPLSFKKKKKFVVSAHSKWFCLVMLGKDNGYGNEKQWGEVYIHNLVTYETEGTHEYLHSSMLSPPPPPLS